jgi:hypothetical protein
MHTQGFLGAFRLGKPPRFRLTAKPDGWAFSCSSPSTERFLSWTAFSLKIIFSTCLPIELSGLVRHQQAQFRFSEFRPDLFSGTGLEDVHFVINVDEQHR